ncbi:MAG: hypothetical protein IAE86_20095 [Burkholderiaceae bacterium]|nr:hypothetical protein [Burkholderiaceae bacterium]
MTDDSWSRLAATSRKSRILITTRSLPMRNISIRILALALMAGLGATAHAQADAPAKSTKSSKAAKKAPQPASSHEVLSSQAKGLALAIDTSEAINDNQLGIAARVLTGKAQCELDRSVDVEPLSEKPGYFQVRFKNVSYYMVPEETTTGAVKLIEKRSGVIWLQIPTKSMLLDSREGHRLVDACTLAEQRAALNAVAAAADSGATTTPVKN